MNIQHCQNGHYFDADRYADGCPYCKTKNPVSGMRDFTRDSAAPANSENRAYDSEKTVPLYPDAVPPQNGAFGVPVPPGVQQPPGAFQPTAEAGATMPLYANAPQPTAEAGAVPPQNGAFGVPVPPGVQQPPGAFPPAAGEGQRVSYSAFFKQFVSKQTKWCVFPAGIAAAIYAAISLVVFIANDILEEGFYIPLIIAALAVLIFVRRKTLYPVLLLATDVIMTIISLSNGTPPGYMDFITVAASILAIITCSKIAKAYKQYKASGIVPEKKI